MMNDTNGAQLISLIEQQPLLSAVAQLRRLVDGQLEETLDFIRERIKELGNPEDVLPQACVFQGRPSPGRGAGIVLVSRSVLLRCL